MGALEIRGVSRQFDEPTIQDLLAVKMGEMGGHRVNVTRGGDGGETQAIVFAVVREDENRTHAARGLTPKQQQWLAQSIMLEPGDASYAGEISPAEAARMVRGYESSAA